VNNLAKKANNKREIYKKPAEKKEKININLAVIS